MLQKMTWEIWQFFTRALILKFGTLVTSICPKLKINDLKTYRGFISHDNEEWCKIWLVNSKLSSGIWRILAKTLENFKNLHFNGPLLTKAYNVWAKKSTEELCLMALNIDAKFEGKLNCAFKNNMRNLVNFHQSTFESLKSGTLVGSFYPK